MSPLLFNLFLSDLPNVFSNECHPVQLCDVKLNCLMFADDLVLLSESAEGLQRCLNNLQTYCEKWSLTINTEKTKVIIFNKGGYKISRHSFMIMNSNIEIVQKYCYLGIIFSSTGNFKNACDALYDKALKAFYKFKQLHPQNNVKIALQLFDTLIFPIVSYAGVVWAPLYATKTSEDNFFTICNNSPIEKLNIKLCKYILGVHKSSTNDAVRGELGRFPLLINILNHSDRFYNRIMTNNNDTLVKISCIDENVCSIDSSWTTSIRNIQQLFCTTSSMQAHMQTTYSDSWSSLMKSHGSDSKLRTFSQFKTVFKLENYIVQFPLRIRRNLTKLRISAHSLAIETGRYTRPKTDVDKRVCFHCKEIESEFHLIFHCKLYTSERGIFAAKLSKFSNLSFTPCTNTFSLIMSCLDGDMEAGTIVCEFINKCFEKRANILNEFNETNKYLRPKLTITRSGRHSKRPALLDL